MNIDSVSISDMVSWGWTIEDIEVRKAFLIEQNKILQTWDNTVSESARNLFIREWQESLDEIRKKYGKIGIDLPIDQRDKHLLFLQAQEQVYEKLIEDVKTASGIKKRLDEELKKCDNRLVTIREELLEAR